MTRPYLVFVNGILAARKLTLKGAQKEARALEARGYSRVSVAEAFEPIVEGLQKAFKGA